MTASFEKWVENLYNKADWESPEEAGKVHYWLSAFVKEVREQREFTDPFYTGAAFNQLIRDFGLDSQGGKNA